jgi:prophage regulatory protein
MTTLIKLNEVKTLTTLSRSTIYKKIAEGTFPAPIKLGDRAVAWLETEIVNWIEQRIESHRSGGVL